MKLAYTLIISSTLLLIGAFFHQPYWYYTVLKTMLFITGLTMWFFGYMFNSSDLKFSAIGTAIFFNPIFSFDYGQDGWRIIAALLLYGMFSFFVMFKELYNDHFPNWEKRLKAPKS